MPFALPHCVSASIAERCAITGENKLPIHLHQWMKLENIYDDQISFLFAKFVILAQQTLISLCSYTILEEPQETS